MSFFDQAEEKGKQLFEKQQNISNNLGSESQTIAERLQSYLLVLHQMREQREHLLRVVTSFKDREKIREKTEQRIEAVKPEKGLR